ncbi:uncharacterized protein BT62DRAFT_930487 [Guyanagaster necrorhizus]|uniref:Velvet domain-containing protein n=1 Tax=Guyanagaster necrorhizus TaxID=856835 RepID=A0A9P7VVT7_9AGAR|nr:uncharacterized protein BT62DRAFT_930487 [Guyanagaster necrorhizus MCA 3950]KAG7447477.1 hypothetical protein BT62DRAFT_930487 [Guyanagaster necrorhizus MCA 3950]
MPALASTDSSEFTWGRWSGSKLYALEVIQNPLRARMCGFGDKDRRPLAPAAVVKMVVKRDDDSTVDVDDIDCSFFLVTVDLWSGDGKQETNLVLHPSLAERYVQQTKRRTSRSGQPPNPTRTPTPPPTMTTDLVYLEPAPPPPQQPPQSFGQEWQVKPDNSEGPEWTADNLNSLPNPSSSPSENVYYELPTPVSPSPSMSKEKLSRSTDLSIPPLPRHTYTRTLIGPLSANATRLIDGHRKPGIFFLFQDLSVRTEGTFRLRLRLMNVGAPPAPEAGASTVHMGMSPVLAQTFTEPFTVFSAKRFPGVPDTTVLSVALANQGQKLPLRNRHRSSTRRRNSASEDSDVE